MRLIYKKCNPSRVGLAMAVVQLQSIMGVGAPSRICLCRENFSKFQGEMKEFYKIDEHHRILDVPVVGVEKNALPGLIRFEWDDE
jgi:hypothetical protein